MSAAANGEGVSVTASVEIPATPAEVWAVMTDCERAPAFVPGLISCRVLDRDPNGAWDVREHVSSPGWLLPNVRTVFRSEYLPHRRVSFARTSGDLAKSKGEWRLDERREAPATRVTYVAEVDYDTLLPGFLLRRHLEDQMVRVLAALRRECIKNKNP